MNFYRPKHFKIQELVPPEVYNSLGERSWLVLDPRIVVSIDQLREHFGPCTVNNWHSGGTLHYRGFRPSDCKVGAQFSQHRFGRAMDCSFNASAPIVREYILANRDKFPFITRMEDDVSWVHIDCGDHGDDDIQVFKP